MNIRERIFAYRFRKQPARQAIFPDFENVRSVLVLYESDLLEKNMVVKALRDELIRMDKDAVIWGYCDKKEITTPILPQARILGKKDINLLGAPKEDVINDLTKRHYDLLIDLTQHPILPLKYVAMYARTNFRAGLRMEPADPKGKEQPELHDLLISTAPQESPRYLFDQIIKYLKMIHTK